MTKSSQSVTVGQRPQLVANAKLQHAYAVTAEAFAPLLAALQGAPDANWPEAQTHYVRTMATLSPTPPDVLVTTVDMGGVPGTLLTPSQLQGERILFYLHGGGYVSGSPAMYLQLAGHFAQLLGAKVYLPDYRLAPAYPYPTPLNDALQAYKWLLDSGHSAHTICFAGDSAGGAMVVSIMVKARNAGLPLPAAGVALSPWANLENTSASMYNRNHLDPLVTRELLTLMTTAFLAGALPTDPDASPVFADVRGLSPILIQAGENEVMLTDALRLATHLGENRVRLSLEVWPGMPHVWHRYLDMLPEAHQAIRNAVTFLEQELATRLAIAG